MDVKHGAVMVQESLQESHPHLLKVVHSEADSLTNGRESRSSKVRLAMPKNREGVQHS
jgi:hypothetical protein